MFNLVRHISFRLHSIKPRLLLRGTRPAPRRAATIALLTSLFVSPYLFAQQNDLAFSEAFTRQNEMSSLTFDQLAAGSGNKALIEQRGNQNTALLSQRGNGNNADITQSGDQNTALVSQTGDSNSSVIEQQGFGNTALIAQKGRRNVAQISQSGTDRSAGIVQNSSGMAIKVTQR